MRGYLAQQLLGQLGHDFDVYDELVWLVVSRDPFARDLTPPMGLRLSILVEKAIEEGSLTWRGRLGCATSILRLHTVNDLWPSYEHIRIYTGAGDSSAVIGVAFGATTHVTLHGSHGGARECRSYPFLVSFLFALHNSLLKGEGGMVQQIMDGRYHGVMIIFY